MKTLLNKKIVVVITACLLIGSVNAQIPAKLKNYLPFKLREAILSSLYNSHAQHKLNDGNYVETKNISVIK